MSEPEKITVKNSFIHGLGVYAACDIKQGEIVVEWKNTCELSQSEFDTLPNSEHAYIEINCDQIFLMGKPERYLNHSCDANTTPGDKYDIACRDIKNGEEITADYSNFYIPDKSFFCTCSSQYCR